ncbi:hypothetical protein [Plasmodium yoelii yoelii]|uniref:Uncharacterized protein n=1 Tax=Plasmodium yoelii yoelii TaxID=73239 RepID=Q7RDP8_PLAYO|nr:hypothetical protein [Plasmodium yoelii yoelii]
MYIIEHFIKIKFNDIYM